MPFRSFARAWRTNEKHSDEKQPSSLAKYMSKWRAVSPQESADAADLACDQAPTISLDEASSTDAGESDESPVVADFADFPSSDGEVSDGAEAASPRSETSTSTCVYSTKMLLRLRSSAGNGAASVCYSTRDISSLPSPSGSPQSKATSKDRMTSQASDRSSWPADSWRQSLPESAADSWVAQQRKRDPAISADDDANVVRAARSILNKLTVEKFDSLFEQLTTCGIKSPDHISMLMREVFEKATTQHHFIPMYADLCVQLEKDPRIAAVVEEAGELHNFRRLLLNQCQHVFEQLLESRSVDASADEDIAFRRKQQALGNMKLIGNLLVHGMLSSDLFPTCCEELVNKRSECPEALESLVALMMVAGPKFDKNSWQYYERLNKVLLGMRKLTKDKSVPPRSRFLIRDVLDARDAGWPNSPAGGIASAKGPAPAKLDDVRTLPTVQQQEDPADRSVPEASAGAKSRGQQSSSCSRDESAQAPVVETKAGRSAGKVAAPAAAAEATEEAFDLVVFRRNLNAVFSDLASDKNIPAAVQRIRDLKVPEKHQADQYVDMLTRIVEERRGAVRRCELAFLAGLGAAESSAFDRKECIAGVGLFFNDVYDELCKEVHRLPPIMKSEFMPTMLSVFPAAELNKVVPSAMCK